MTGTSAPLRIVALAVAIAGLAGCTADDKAETVEQDQPAKAGYQTVSAEGVSLEVPAGWVKDPTPRQGPQILKYGTLELTDGSPEQLVTATVGESEYKKVDEAARAQAANTLTLVPGAEQTGRRAITVRGAGRGLVTTITVPGVGGGTDSLYDLVAITSGGKRVFVRVTSTSNDAALADTVLGSVRVRG